MNDAMREHCALVIGLSSHGLTIARSLNAAGVNVFAMEDNPRLPGYRTTAATVITVASLKSDSLFEDLQALRRRLPAETGVVLFPTNDTTVANLARGIHRLPAGFRLSWADSASTVLSLLSKSSIEAQSIARGLNYPRSFVANNLAEAVDGARALNSPYIAKPVTPQSGFKALRFADSHALENTLARYPDEFPVLVQEWIEGTAKDLFFCAVYLQAAECVARFTGKKLESYPPALGQTTVAVSVDDAAVEAATLRFFEGTGLSGPASLELKRAPDGELWVIEPTVGRSDFWLGLCTTAGFNLPLMEFRHAVQGDIDPPETARRPAIWFDSERDPAAPLRHAREYALPGAARRKVHFSYLNAGDRAPFFRAAGNTLTRALQKLRGQPAKREGGQLSVSGFDVQVAHRIDGVPAGFLSLLEKSAGDYPFYSPDWFHNLAERVAETAGEIRFVCIADGRGNPAALVPLWFRAAEIRGMHVQKVSLLSNYYSPRMDIFNDGNYLDKAGAVGVAIRYLRRSGAVWHLLELSPLPYATGRVLANGLFPVFSYPVTVNYFHALPDTVEDYLTSRSSRLQQTIRRRGRKIQRAGEVEFEIKTGDSDLSAEITNYHNVYTSSWKIDEPYPEFINGLIELAARKGWLRLGTLALDGKVIASQIWLVSEGTAYIFKLAYDKDYSQYSPGTLLTAALIDHVITLDGATRLDFLLGSDAFKAEWMDNRFAVYGIQYPNVRSAKGLVVALLNTASVLRKKIEAAP